MTHITQIVKRKEALADNDSAYAYADGWNACVDAIDHYLSTQPELNSYVDSCIKAHMQKYLDSLSAELPEPDTHCVDDDTGKDVWSYSRDQLLQTLAARDAEIARLEPLQYRKAPCYKFCESTAFEVEIRQLKAERDAALEMRRKISETCTCGAGCVQKTGDS